MGNNSTWGEEVVGSGIYNNASFSIGQYHYETDGFRDNAFLRDNIFNAFLQYNLFPQTSIQGEFRYRDFEYGDLQLRFFPDDFFPNQRQKEETNSIRLGFHHNFAPGSDLIGNFMYQNVDASFHDVTDWPDYFLRDIWFIDPIKEEALSGELQYLFRSKYLKITGGAGFFKVDTKEVWTDLYFDTSFFPPFFLSPPDNLIEKRHIRHTNFYLYSYVNFPKNVTFTIGASADLYDGGVRDQDQFNPKFGITWNPFVNTTVRGAVFRTLKRTLVTNQTLEPTQVAGFNQFFDDPNVTESWRYGIGIDQKFSKDIYGGIEYSQRDLEVPFLSYPAPSIIKTALVDWKERLGRAYLYWTPHKWFGLSAEYQYEKFDRDKKFVAGIKKAETHRVPLGINFYHPSGLGASLKATYFNQDGEFQRQITGDYMSGKDQFWLFDTAINYRLPKKYGFITLGAKNLLNKHFRYYDVDPVNPVVQPDRLIFLKVTLALP